MKKFKKHFAVFLLLAVSALGFALTSHAAFVSPTKVFIQDGQTSASISITNNGDDPVVLTLEWERRVRSKDGTEMSLLKEGETFEGYQPADPYLIFSPRKVVVEAHETQRLRILAQRPKDMAPGEYRSHLKIVPDSVEPPPKQPTSPGEFGGVFAIRPAMSIPVMLRTGKTVIDMKIVGAKITQEQKGQFANVSMVNNSTRSIYGSGVLKCKTPAGEDIKAKSNGFKLYLETKTFNEKFIIPETVAPSKCNALDLELFATNEPEYTSRPIATVKLK